MVLGGQGVGLQGPRGSRGRPTESQWVKGEGKMFHSIGSTATFDGSSGDL